MNTDRHLSLTQNECDHEALMEAARTGNAEDVALLITTSSRAQCSAALAEAVRESLESNQHHDQCVQLLIPASQAMSYDNNIALRLAAVYNNHHYITALLPVSDPLFDDSKPLMYAAMNGNVECLKLLLPVSDPHAKNSRALRVAAQRGHLECVRLLIPCSDPQAGDHFALCLALNAGHVEISELLYDAYDLAGLSEALTKLKNNYLVDDIELVSLRQRITSQHEHSVLSQLVASEQHSLKKKM